MPADALRVDLPAQEIGKLPTCPRWRVSALATRAESSASFARSGGGWTAGLAGAPGTGVSAPSIESSSARRVATAGRLAADTNSSRGA